MLHPLVVVIVVVSIVRAYISQPKSLKSITTRHDGTKRNTRNTTQVNKTQYMEIVTYAKSITTRHGSVGSVVPLVLLGSAGFRCSVGFRCSFGFRFSFGFRWVPLFLSVPLLRCSVGFRWVPLFRWVPCSVGFRWVSLFRWFLCSIGSRWVPLFRWFRWFLLFPMVPLGSVVLLIQVDPNPSRRQHSTTQYNKTTENEEVSGRGGSL